MVSPLFVLFQNEFLFHSKLSNLLTDREINSLSFLFSSS